MISARYAGCLTQYTRQKLEGAREPKVCMDNRKPFRTKEQKAAAVRTARRGLDGVYRAPLARLSFHIGGP